MKAKKVYLKVGRPCIITEDIVVKLVAAFQNGLSTSTACQYAQISRDAYYDRRRKDPEFCDIVDNAKNFLKLLAGKRLMHILQNGDDRDAASLIKFVLERLEPEQFGTKKGIEINQSFTFTEPDWFLNPLDIVDNQKIEESSQQTLI